MQDQHSHHIVPVKTYLMVFAALMVLLVATVGVAFFDFGALSKIIAMTIATAKALLIMTVFMHLRYSSKLTWLLAGIGFLWLVILFAITMGDYVARGSIAGPLG